MGLRQSTAPQRGRDSIENRGQNGSEDNHRVLGRRVYQISDVYVGGGLCLYLQNPALGLGVCAAIFLIVAQIIFAAFGGCWLL
ncbi:hypothetical protein ZWY2020_040666 [Hordeum vulgare]|nr:hypothetical protein ZWY2020_040666 [Hordeum vulgare]